MNEPKKPSQEDIAQATVLIYQQEIAHALSAILVKKYPTKRIAGSGGGFMIVSTPHGDVFLSYLDQFMKKYLNINNVPLAKKDGINSSFDPDKNLQILKSLSI